ncbi:hypothetical protein ACQBAU_16335 [Propionibacteriaceae bacterium Y2011]
MASKQVGSGHVAIFPSLKGFGSAVAKETTSAGRSGGRSFSNGFKAATADLAGASLKKLQTDVSRASQSLSRARLAEADAAGKVRAAEASLADARQNSTSGSARLVAAEEKLASAKRRLETAQDKTAASSKQLTAAQSALEEQTEETGQAGGKAASQYSRGWAGIRERISTALRGGVRAAGNAAEAEAKASGTRAGGLFRASLASAIGNLAAQGFSRLGQAMGTRSPKGCVALLILSSPSARSTASSRRPPGRCTSGPARPPSLSG